MAFLSQFINVTSTSPEESSLWIYLVDWILALILSLTFVFYFNRFVGYIISSLLKLLFWKSLGLRINVESIKISPLGGRIFAKNVTIISQDMAISVLNLTLTWRYWLFKLTKLSNYYFDEGFPDSTTSRRVSRLENEELPCRLFLMVDGLEVFMYNRTFAYDNIMDMLRGEEKDRKESTSDENSKNTASTMSADSGSTTNNLKYRGNTRTATVPEASTSDWSQNEKSQTQQPPQYRTKLAETTLFFLLGMLPLKVRVKKGAVVLGNVTTPSILVVSYKSANGILDISKSPNPLDKWRFLHDLNFENFQLWLKPNIGYEKHRYVSPDDLRHETKSTKNMNHYKRYKYWYKFERAASVVQKAFHKLKRRKKGPDLDEDYGTSQWRGLRRYVGEDDRRMYAMLNMEEEYAKVSLILDSQNTRIVYYYDTPGAIPLGPVPYKNSGLHPEHGVELEVTQGTIHYGAWADRQRVPLQGMFFPAIAKDAVETQLPTSPGEARQYAGFKLAIVVKDEVIFRVPTRELSKDKALLRKTASGATPKTSRSFGWIEVKMGAGSTISSFTSYIASKKEGWPNTLNVLFNEPELRTSVNHDVLYAADSHEINARIGFPLQWNGRCNWKFDMVSENARIFFLREHTMLFSDLFSDFASGEPTPYESFRVFVYNIGWELHDYKLYLNVNDANIINNPLDFNNNKYLSFQGEKLNVDLNIPLLGKFSRSTEIGFKICTSYFDLVLDTPPWHTANAFMKDSKLMGKANNFTVDGSYTFFNTVEVNTSDYIEIRCIGDYISVKFYGFVIKYLFLIRENYFGETIHFKTFEEYTNEEQADTDGTSTLTTNNEAKTSASQEFDYWKILKTDNDIDIFFTFQVRHGLVILPYNLYSCTSHFGLSFDSLDVDIRFSNYYMDLECDVSPINTVFVRECKATETDILFNIPKYREMYLSSKTPDIQFDGLTIHAHRMFGPPPEEITYYCKWDFAISDILFDSGMLSLAAVVTCVRNFIFCYKDIENAMQVEIPLLWDATHLSFRCPHMEFKITPEKSSQDTLVACPYIMVTLDSFIFNFNDNCNKRYNKLIEASLPSIDVKIIEPSNSSDGQDLILGYLKTSLVFSDICQKPDMVERTRLQQHHIKFNDAPFHRSPFLIFPEGRDVEYNDPYGCLVSTLTLPDVSHPLSASFPGDLDEEEFNNYVYDSELSSNVTLQSEEDNTYFSKMPPRQDYDDADYNPSYKVDPLYDYDNIVLELGEVQSFFTPKSLTCIARVASSSSDHSVDVLMDDFHIQIVKHLKVLLTSFHTVVNLRLISPDISIQFGRFDTTDTELILCKSHNIPIAHFQLLELSLALNIKKLKTQIGSLDDLDKEVSFAFHLKELLLTISNPSEFEIPLLFNIKEVEFWSLTHDDSIVSASVDTINLEVNDDQVEWIIDFAESMRTEIETAMDEFEKNSFSEHDAFAELAYKLTLASIDYQIDHDPGVLTKPAYILRSRKEHIRFIEGWQITARLRHVLNYLPCEWFETEGNNIGSRDWKLPESAYDEVSMIFSRWRSWEANNEQRTNFFNKVFLADSSSDTNPVGLTTSVSEANFKIKKSRSEFDYISAQEIGAILRFRENLSLGDLVPSLSTVDPVLGLEGVFNMSGYKSKISDISMNYLKRILAQIKVIEANNNEELQSDEKPKKFDTRPSFKLSIITNVNNFHQHVILPSTTFEIVGASINSSVDLALLQEFPDSIFLSALNGSDFYELNTWSGESRLVSLRSSNYFVLFSNVGEVIEGIKNCKLSLGKFTFRILDENDILLHAIDNFLNVDLKYLQGLSNESDNFKKVNSTPRTEYNMGLLEQIGDISLNINVGEFVWLFELLKPLNFGGIILDNNFSLSKVGSTITMDSLIGKINMNASLDTIQLLELQNSQILTKLKFSKVVDLYICSISSGVGYTKLFSPQLFRTIEKLAEKSPDLMQRVNQLQEYLKFENKDRRGNALEKIEKKEPLEKDRLNILDKIAFKVKFTNDYIGVSSFVENTKYSLEVENTSIRVSDVLGVFMEDDFGISHKVVPIYGDLIIPTARIYILDRTVPVGLSNIMDVNFAVKLFNDHDSVQRKGRNFQLESQYCRICLGPSTLFKIVDLTDMLKLSGTRLVNAISKCRPSESVPNKTESSSGSNGIQFSGIQILSYNFCLGWIFNNKLNEYPGIILGAERFFAITENGLGKFTLMDAFLSVANGSRSSNFYSKQSERTNLNRAFLPRMQLTFTTQKRDEKKTMEILIQGDELDVKFLSTSIVMTEYAVSSGNEVLKYFNARAERIAELTKQSQENSSSRSDNDEAKEYINTLKSAFDSIEVVAKFAGSTVLFHRLDNDEHGNTPSLFLHSPAVKIAFKYDHHKFEKKKHVIKGEVLTSSSSNTLYAFCVPVVVDIVTGIKRMMRRANIGDSNREKGKRIETVPASKGSMEFASLLGEMDIHFGLRIEKQELTLSCEPTAKVAAIVGLDGIFIQLNSGDKVIPSLMLAVLFDSVSASLQHIYSREISGSVSIKKVLLSSAFEFNEIPSVLSSGCIVDVDAYVNVKQYQDLELFKDIWFPSHYVELYSSFVASTEEQHKEVKQHRSELASNKNLSTRFKEVSTSYAMPWIVTFFVTNFCVQVDFGPSLCNSKLKFDRFWAVSKKSTDWSQDLKAGINCISLEAEGRLGGHFSISQMNIHTAISWKLESGATLDVPLILISAGTEKLQLKLSFDYHVFAIANIEDFSVDVFNQKSEISISKDHLSVATKFNTAEVYITSLTASNCLDIYNTISRMIQENRRSYKETLVDSSRERNVKDKRTAEVVSDAILETVKKLETKIEVIAGHLLIHVYPTSFDDLKVLVVKLDESKANFQQNEYSSGISNELEIKFNDLVVSLSITSPVSESFIAQCSVDEFVDYAYKARGGTIFIFPSFKISMRTFQKYDELLIEYLYQSSFDGTVDIRWNLGSVNFIREMFAIHKKALESRMEYKKHATEGFREDIFATQGTKTSSLLQEDDESEDPTDAIKEAINESIDKVSQGSKYIYSPLAPPIIEAPQLKELGNATPPLEWFGLNRDKFPNVTHQLGIVTLQKLIHEVELRYSKVLGKA